MNDLLPCPFCGGEAEILTAESMHGGYLFGIMCNDCRSRGDVYDTEAEAIAAWNSRAERTCHVTFKRGAIYDVANYSCCGYEFAESISEQSVAENYCPNCGAKVVDE